MAQPKAANAGTLRRSASDVSRAASAPRSYSTTARQTSEMSLIDMALVLASLRRNSHAKVNYHLVDYIKYEFSGPADAAKKTLEHSRVEEALTRIYPSRRGLKSLDIGCATCRYPLWFASLGYHATGYDVDPVAVEICQRKANGNPLVRIACKDVLRSEPEPKSYDVITCMMGTFNHFSIKLRSRFFKWAYESLNANGMLIFSAWNPMCPYTSLLAFYTRAAREQLERQMTEPGTLAKRILRAGFEAVEILPAVFLPDSCYEAWSEGLAANALVEIERTLYNNLSCSEAQLVVFFARKSN